MNNLKKTLNLIWKWSWLVTLPAAALFITWGSATWSRYEDFGLRYDCRPFDSSLLRIGRMEFAHLVETAQNLLRVRHKTESAALRTIDLFFSEADENRLNSNLPHSGRDYIEGKLIYPDGDLKTVKIKYRGDFVQHWGYYKKSLRVKTKKKNLFEGMRSFNINAPKFSEQINNYLSYRLARMLGLLAPRVEMVYLRVNGENRGIHLLLEQLEELTLREAKRMPGDLYAGELVAEDAYTGINNHLFDHPQLWEKIAVNNHYPEDSRKPIERLTDLMARSSSEDAQKQTWAMLDGPTWGRFALFEILTQTLHYDRTHNWRLYYDPARSRLEPVVWDPDGWAPFSRPHERQKPLTDIYRISELHDHLIGNYQFLLARYEAAEEFFESGLDRKFLDELDATVALMGSALSHERLIVSNFESVSPEQSKKAMDQLADSVKNIFREVREAYLGENGSVEYALAENGRLKLSIEGRRPVKALQLNFSNPPDSQVTARVVYWVDGKRTEADVSGAVETQGTSVMVKVPLLARHIPVSWVGNYLEEERGVQIRPAYYELILNGISRENTLVDLLAERGKGHFKRARQVADLEKIEFRDAYGVVAPCPVKKPKIWEGNLTFEGVQQIKEDVYIKPGTTIRMKEGASLILEGRLTAEGTTREPIRFIGTENHPTPWGAVVLKGKGARGSRLVHCEFSEGSGLKDDFSEYSGMFSVHDVQDVSIEHCSFRDSKIVDDMVHAVYSEIHFSDCTFERALYDALDLDICTATIERCRFLNSGNDGIDAMTSETGVRDCLFQGGGDKGISIGEGSVLFALNNRFVGNQIGVQVKDGSEAVFYNTEWVNNQKAVDAYKKNWRYGKGGIIRLYKGYLFGNGSAISADEESEIWVYDSSVQGEIGQGKHIKTDATVDGSEEKRAKVSTPWRYPEDKTPKADFFERYWSQTDPTVRGCYGFTD